jgi:nucleotide-binding universal stress UspA family protein
MSILVGYKPSSESDAALEWAVNQAREKDDHVTVLNTTRGEALLERPRLYDDEAKALAERLDATGVSYSLRRDVHPGDPADRLLEIAEELGVQMIVIGLRRRSPTGKFFFGSTAQKILLEADCPVVAVKAPR